MKALARLGCKWAGLPAVASQAKAGAGEGDRTLVLSLENSCSTIELHPHTVCPSSLGKPSYNAASAFATGPTCHAEASAKTDGGRGRTRTYEAVKQGIYSPPPLPLGTLSPDTKQSEKLRKRALYAVRDS